MKISFPHPAREQGSALIVTLTLGVIMLVAASSYLMLVGTQKTVVTRSQTWNAALAMAEAGVEEAMAQINASPANYAANGWSANGTNFSLPTPRTLAGGSYSVRISGNTNPVIYATGYTTVPITGAVISRAVKVTTGQDQSVFNVAFAAINNINFNGNGVASDSWNSHDTNYSTNGQYDSNKIKHHGNVASVKGLVDIGNHTIDGNLYLGPLATYNGGGTVTGTIYNDFNVNFDDVQLPTGASGWTIATPTIVTNGFTKKGVPITTSTYNFAADGNYILQDNAYPIEVQAGVTVQLNVTATSFDPTSLSIHGGMVNSGTAKIYFNGPTSASIHGNDAVDASNRPENLYYYGLPSLTSLTFGGTSSFVGVIYAPEASLTLNGGGNNIGVVGSAVVKAITMNGHYNFHYDESLANYGVSRGFIARSWQELN